jgi:hypothetical protein
MVFKNRNNILICELWKFRLFLPIRRYNKKAICRSSFNIIIIKILRHLFMHYKSIRIIIIIINYIEDL